MTRTFSREDLTIVVPVWDDYVEMLGEAVAAFRSAPGPPVRLLVVDNASRRPLPPLAGVERMTLPRRVSPGAARNLALARVDTPLVLFWDVDDLPIPTILPTLLAALCARPDVVAAAARSLGWDPATDQRSPWPWPRGWAYRLARRPWMLALGALASNPFPTTGPVVLRTSAARDAGGFSEDTSYGEDWGLSAALALRGRVVLLRDHGRLYRVHGASLTRRAQASPDAYAGALRSLRRRARRDPRTPWWMAAALPLVGTVHAVKVVHWSRGATGAGYYQRRLSGHR